MANTAFCQSFSLVKCFMVMVLLIILGILLHPKIFNLRFPFINNYEAVQMNYVSDFFLWTRNTRVQSERIIVGDKDNLRNSYFIPRPTYIIIHGFICSGLDDWVIRMKDALLRRLDSNIISVNWKAGSITMGYYVIQERVPLVGEDVATLIDYLQTVGQLTNSQVHIIGHSLGAHIAGFAGKSLAGRVNRITGLDPAGVGYSSLSSSGRLDKTDANYVDIIHTHGCYSVVNHWTDCYGIDENIGDADFWPNGGEYQPACEERGDGEEEVREGSNCNHGMAYVFYTESVSYYPTTTRYAARKCQSWQLYNNDSCPCEGKTQYMGFNVNKRVVGVFYLNTSDYKPFGNLDPECSPGQYSFLRYAGVSMCLLLTLWGVAINCLHFASIRNRERFKFLMLF